MRRIPGRAGFTLLEMMIALLLVGVAGAAVLEVLQRGSDSVSTGTEIAELERSQTRALGDLADELRQAGLLTLNPPVPSGVNALTFRTNTGYSGGAIQWSTPITIAYQDPGQLVRTQDGVTQVLLPVVPPTGVSFTLNGSRLTLQLLLQETVDNHPVERSVTTTVMIRN